MVHLGATDRLQRRLRAIGNDWCIPGALTFDQTENDGLAVGTAAAFAFNR